METKERIAKYYDGYDEDERLVSKHGMVEYLTSFIFNDQIADVLVQVCNQSVAYNGCWMLGIIFQFNDYATNCVHVYTFWNCNARISHILVQFDILQF